MRPGPAHGSGIDRVAALTTLGELVAGLSPEAIGWGATDTVAVYLADITDFKQVNDLLGYTAGDEVLDVLARRIAEWAPQQHVLVRIEADRFVVVAPVPLGADGAQAASVRLRDTLTRPVAVRGTSVARRVAIGVAAGPLSAVALGELFARADDALQVARRSWSDDPVGYRPELHDDLARRAEIELRLSDHVAAGMLSVEYQPEFDIRNGAVVGVEALTRWDHPTLGRLLPDQFIGIAERTAAIGLVGEWVLREACGQLAAWQRELPGLPLVMRVNVSPRQLADDALPDLIADVLASAGLSSWQLGIELTEFALSPDVPQMARVLQRVRDLGVGVALDDVGTGHNSLSYLRSLPVDVLKIDREFVLGLGHDPASNAIVGALAHLAGALRLGVVAEGVASIDAVDVLERLGCFRAQGHLLAPAAPADALRPLLQAGRLPANWRSRAAGAG
jgi:diguanylate cyclase (GGDEF)-like protein